MTETQDVAIMSSNEKTSPHVRWGILGMIQARGINVRIWAMTDGIRHGMDLYNVYPGHISA